MGKGRLEAPKKVLKILRRKACEFDSHLGHQTRFPA
jgi:hypothetical protein